MMKKSFSLLAAICLVSSFAFSQGVGGGVKGILSLNTHGTTIDGEPVIDPSTNSDVLELNLGAGLGAFVEYMFTEKIGMQAELNYSGEGTGWAVKDCEDCDAYVERWNMINIPIMLKYNIKGVDVFAGPQISKALGGKAGFGSEKEKWTTDDLDGSGIKTNWVSVVVGASKEVSGIVLDLRGSFAGEIYPEDASLNPDKWGATPFSLQLSVGYKLFGKRDDG